MKSKITLIILLVVIVFLSALSFFFGYKYLNANDEVKSLKERIDVMTKLVEDMDENQQKVEDGKDDETENVKKSIEIPKFDEKKVDISARESLNPQNIKENGVLVADSSYNFQYRIGPSTNANLTSLDDVSIKYQVRYHGREYNISDTANIVDVKYQYPGFHGVSYAIILLDDGSIKYTCIKVEDDGNDLEFKDYDIKDVVSLVKLEYSTPRKMTCIGAITSDGVTHLLPMFE